MFADVDAPPMKDVLKALPALIVVCGPPLAAGLSGRRGWGWVWVLGLVSLAGAALLSEPKGYDMPGFGLRLFGAGALLAAFALAVGSAVRRLAIRDARRLD